MPFVYSPIDWANMATTATTKVPVPPKERSNPPTIADLFGMRVVTGFRSGHGVTEGMPLPEQLVGLELEIEGFPIEDDRHQFGGIVFDHDGSLRNNGIEAITKPIATKYVERFLQAFYEKFGITQRNYTDRTSTHVHFNVQPLTIEQINTLCLVYQTVENLLFKYVGNERDQNLYCVPWSQCGLTYNVAQKLENNDPNDVFRRWQKYAACNLMPASSLGTIEFRHLHGTCDVKQIVQWISLISKLFEYAQKSSLKATKDQILNMNTVSNYREWMVMLFGKYADLLTGSKFETELAAGVVDSKLMLMKTDAQPQGAATLGEWPAIFDDPFRRNLDPPPADWTEGFRMNLPGVNYDVHAGELRGRYRDRISRAERNFILNQGVVNAAMLGQVPQVGFPGELRAARPIPRPPNPELDAAIRTRQEEIIRERRHRLNQEEREF